MTSEYTEKEAMKTAAKNINGAKGWFYLWDPNGVKVRYIYKGRFVDSKRRTEELKNLYMSVIE